MRGRATRTMSVRITDDLWEEFGRAAERLGKSKNELVLEAIRHMVTPLAAGEVLEEVAVPILFARCVDDIIVWRGKRGRTLGRQELLRGLLYAGTRQELSFEASADRQAKAQIDATLESLLVSVIHYG